MTDTDLILYSVQCCYAVHWTDKNKRHLTQALQPAGDVDCKRRTPNHCTLVQATCHLKLFAQLKQEAQLLPIKSQRMALSGIAMQQADVGYSRRGKFGGSQYGFDLFADGTNVYGSRDGSLMG